LSPLVRAGPAAVVILVAAVAGGRGGQRTADLIRIGVVALVIVFGFISWAVTRWRLADGALQIDTGLIRRSSLRFPLTQIQAVDIVSPGLARIFGLSELRVRMASGNRSTGRLAYMQSAHADAVRTQLLDLARAQTIEAQARAHPDAPIPPAAAPFTPLYTVDVSRLVGSILLSFPAVALYLILGTLIVVAALAPGAAAGAVAGSISALLGFSGAVWTRFNGEYRMSLGVDPDGLQVRTGLIQTTAETIPWGRIQALRTIQPVFWRPFGWYRVEADVAGKNVGGRQNQAARRAGRALIPVGVASEVEWLAQLVMPGTPDRLAPPPHRAVWKSPLRYRRLSFAWNEQYAVTTSGRLRRVTDRVPLAKVQSLRWSSGPVQRRLRLASIHFHTAGRSVYSLARDRDEREADQLIATLPDVCRRARSTEFRRR
jgi:putative membrane protein